MSAVPRIAAVLAMVVATAAPVGSFDAAV